jgi:hypothetical protein
VTHIHFAHARVVDFGALGDTTLSCAIFVHLVELLMQDLLLFDHHSGLLLFILLQSHHHLLEGLLMGLLNHEVLDGWVALLALHIRFD